MGKLSSFDALPAIRHAKEMPPPHLSLYLPLSASLYLSLFLSLYASLSLSLSTSLALPLLLLLPLFPYLCSENSVIDQGGAASVTTS
jgi:hypothetical protein